VARFKRSFPDREDQLDSQDFDSHRSSVSAWRSLFSCYDLVIGYSTDPMLPMMADVPYFALEHGTLREIPFDGTRQARLTAAAYHCAHHVFVTNWDCLPNAHILAGDAVTFLNHPFDDDHAENITDVDKHRQRLLRELDAEVLIFFPTRHDWIPDSGYADKGNDVLIRAFARLRQSGLRVGMVCCRWGQNVRESQQLLNDLGVARHVTWSPPLGMVAFERTALACDVVADQFTLGSYGGIMVKSMAARVPVCTYLDEDGIGQCFDSFPPIINAQTEEEIFRELKAVISDPVKLRQIGCASKQWIEENYGSRQTVDLQLEQFRRFFEHSGLLSANPHPQAPSAEWRLDKAG